MHKLNSIMISAEQRIAITRLIKENMSPRTPSKIITRLELHLYNAANGNSDIYNDTSNIKQRIKNVFIEFEERKKESTKKVIISRFGALPEKKRKDKRTACTNNKRTKTECANTSSANTSGANTSGANTSDTNTSGTKYIHLLDIADIDSDAATAMILSNIKNCNK